MPAVLITGAAGGIGRHLCQGFAAQGFHVLACDREDCRFAHPHIHSQVMDLCCPDAIQAAFARAVDLFGPLHVLINNGAVSHFCKPLEALTVAEWDAVLHTNLRGAALCCQAFLAANAGAGYGRIINMASTRWQQNEAHWEAYGASKGGLVALTQSLCVSLRGRGITVNAISPGWIHTGDAAELSAEDHAQHPSGRVGRPDDILRACLFLADAANDFVNGVNLPVDGGMTRRMIYSE
ncbi:SDR family oxidoreductase [uncultured Desulfovibrio sp.]|uniref:SDR family NAD(P)-dependent oxidoreductase n=1 Tax=uncultured Desulfovibrio sp. TaxID=167968 RepID=UPI00260572F4|nr:SDR family oxidoreductase [uncultured Desulfovibrio sp.]